MRFDNCLKQKALQKRRKYHSFWSKKGGIATTNCKGSSDGVAYSVGGVAVPLWVILPTETRYALTVCPMCVPKTEC